MAASDFRIVVFAILLSWTFNMVTAKEEEENGALVGKLVEKAFDLMEDGSGRSMKLKKLFLPMLLALKVKLATVILVGVTAIVGVTITALFANLGSILLSGLIFLTSATEHHPKRTITTVISPHPDVVHHHWDREEQSLQQPDPYYSQHQQDLTPIAAVYDESQLSGH